AKIRDVGEPERSQKVRLEAFGLSVVGKATPRVLRCCSVVARGLYPLPPFLPLAGSADQIGTPDHLGYRDLRCVEVDALDPAHHIEDRGGSRAGAVRTSLGLVPTPGWMIVEVRGVWAPDMR